MNNILSKSVLELTRDLHAKEYSCTELTQLYLDSIEENNKKINAYITIDEKSAISEAKKADQRRSKSEPLSELDGIPFAAKDNISTKNMLTTCGSKMLSKYIPPFDAHVIETLKAKGLVLLGKTNLDEFAMGISTETSYFGTVSNPLDTERVAGGSSGGSAAAVAALMAPFALGSDTGGSVRQPAAFCGTVGLRPTYGALSRYGLISFAPSLDQIGVISKNVRDNALVMNVLRAKDTHDETSTLHPCTDMLCSIDNEITSVKIALLDSSLMHDVSSEVKCALERSAKALRDMGAQVDTVSLAYAKSAYAAYYTIACAEASSNMARFDGVRYGFRADGYTDTDDLYRRSRAEGFGDEVKRRILFGTLALSAEYSADFYDAACNMRSVIGNELLSTLQSYDAILMPTAPTVAYKKGEAIQLGFDAAKDDIFCVIAALAGLPALSIPAQIADKLPVGIQLLGKHFSEPLLYQIATSLEKYFSKEDV